MSWKGCVFSSLTVSWLPPISLSPLSKCMWQAGRDSQTLHLHNKALMPLAGQTVSQTQKERERERERKKVTDCCRVRCVCVFVYLCCMIDRYVVFARGQLRFRYMAKLASCTKKQWERQMEREMERERKTGKKGQKACVRWLDVSQSERERSLPLFCYIFC